jgi:hypothetical protein
MTTSIGQDITQGKSLGESTSWEPRVNELGTIARAVTVLKIYQSCSDRARDPGSQWCRVVLAIVALSFPSPSLQYLTTIPTTILTTILTTVLTVLMYA